MASQHGAPRPNLLCPLPQNLVTLPAPYPWQPLLVGEANTLFRSNSLASKSMESFLKVSLYGILSLFYI